MRRLVVGGRLRVRPVTPVVAALWLATLALLPSLASGAPVDAGAPLPGRDFVKGEIVVRLAPGTPAVAGGDVAGDAEARLARRLPLPGAALLRVEAGGSVARSLGELDDDPRVLWAEPNYVYRGVAVPDDPGFPLQWGLANAGQAVQSVGGTPGADIDGPAAWDRTTGTPGVKLAIIDGGVDATHPDLAPNLATPANPGEAGGGREANGVDDDGNGLVDDYRGWDFVSSDNDPRDEDGHGSHVAGVAAARGGDGIGIAGVSWQARLVAVRALDAAGDGTAAGIAAAIVYAGERGVRVANASFGGDFFSQAISDAIADAPNMLVVAAAGNGGASGVGRNLDPPSVTSFPCEAPHPNVVCVAATDQRDRLTSFSDYGASAVDLAAPGDNILSSVPGGYRYLDGTSFAAPHVAGAAALVLAATPGASTAQVRGALVGGADAVPALAGRVATGGRLSAAGALAVLAPAGPGPSLTPGPAVEVGETTARLTGTVETNGGRTAVYFEHGPTPAYGAETPTRRARAGAFAASEVVSALTPGTAHHYRLVAANASGITYGPDQAFTTAAPPAAPQVGRLAASDLTVRRIGGAWFASLRLRSFTVVSGRLERRLTSFRTVRGIRRRGYAPGVRRIPLGRLAARPHRLTLDVVSTVGPQRLRRAFRVLPPVRPRLAVVTRGGLTAARLRLARRSTVGGRLERQVRTGRGLRPVRRLPARAYPAGVRRLVPGRGLPAGAYRLRVVTVADGRREVLVERFRVRPSSPRERLSSPRRAAP